MIDGASVLETGNSGLRKVMQNMGGEESQGLVPDLSDPKLTRSPFFCCLLGRDSNLPTYMVFSVPLSGVSIQ